MWGFTGQRRPDFAEAPGPGQESVWDYPRPPRVVSDARAVLVKHGDRVVAESRASIRVCETASPPTFYLPADDVHLDLLQPMGVRSFCEWKGAAMHWALKEDPSRTIVGWSYPEATDAFASIKGYMAFYPSKLQCFVAGERVRPQPGSFYGGWITSDVVGPFKGEPGTSHW